MPNQSMIIHIHVSSNDSMRKMQRELSRKNALWRSQKRGNLSWVVESQWVKKKRQGLALVRAEGHRQKSSSRARRWVEASSGKDGGSHQVTEMQKRKQQGKLGDCLTHHTKKFGRCPVDTRKLGVVFEAITRVSMQREPKKAGLQVRGNRRTHSPDKREDLGLSQRVLGRERRSPG